jgi:hypothetical protein
LVGSLLNLVGLLLSETLCLGGRHIDLLDLDGTVFEDLHHLPLHRRVFELVEALDDGGIVSLQILVFLLQLVDLNLSEFKLLLHQGLLHLTLSILLPDQLLQLSNLVLKQFLPFNLEQRSFLLVGGGAQRGWFIGRVIIHGLKVGK